MDPVSVSPKKCVWLLNHPVTIHQVPELIDIVVSLLSRRQKFTPRLLVIEVTWAYTAISKFNCWFLFLWIPSPVSIWKEKAICWVRFLSSVTQHFSSCLVFHNSLHLTDKLCPILFIPHTVRLIKSYTPAAFASK